MHQESIGVSGTHGWMLLLVWSCHWIFCFKWDKSRGFGNCMEVDLVLSTSIVGTDIRMSNLDIRLSNLDIRMSSLDIRMSKLILEFGKNKTAKNSEILVAFRIFFHFFNTPYGWKIRARYAKRHNQVGHTFVQVGHTYVQAEYIGWTYVCPTL